WGSSLFRRALGEVAEGVRSAAEGDLRDLIVWARLPMPLFNPRLLVGPEFLAMPDCWWPESGVAAEADSRAWHFSPGDWEQTVALHPRMGPPGILVPHSPPRQIVSRREQVANIIRRALAGGQKLPKIRTTPADQRNALAVGRQS